MISMGGKVIGDMQERDLKMANIQVATFLNDSFMKILQQLPQKFEESLSVKNSKLW